MGQEQTKILQDHFVKAKEQNDQKAIAQIIQTVANLAGDGKEALLSKTLEIFGLPNQQLKQDQYPQDSVKQEQTPIEPASPLNKLFQSQIYSITKTQSQICSTIVEIMSTRKLYHIRESFRRLALEILHLQNAEFYVFHDSGRIQYHDFRDNYITRLLEENQKKKIIQHLLANTSQSVENLQLTYVKKENKNEEKSKAKIFFGDKSQSLMKLFKNTTIQPEKFYMGQINKQSERYSIISMFTYENQTDSTLGQALTINPKIIQKLIKISMIQVEEESEYDIIQYYAKELLDILGLIVGDSEANIKLLLKQESLKMGIDEKQPNKEIQKLSLTQTIKYLFYSDVQLIECLIPISSRYQQFRFELLQRQRMYSKYLCEDNVLFMDFDEQGELYFIANNRKNSQYETLLYNLALSDELCIEKIFVDNTELQQHIRKALQGTVKNKKLYELQSGIKARVVINETKEIQRIMVLIEDPPLILSHGSYSSSTLQGMSTSQKKKKAGSTGSDSVSLGKGSKGSHNLIKTLEKQNPGITQNGWLNLFIKDHELKRNDSNVMAKKKRTLFARGQEGPYSTKTISAPLNFDEIEFLQEQDINSPDTNLLLFELDYLEPFVKKVFSSMKYFKTLDYNNEHFDNFLFHLHEGYQLHDNPFHNFVHGVNVMHTCFLICGIEGNAEILSPIKVFSTVLSGLCHDVGHTGRTNSFQIASRSKKALTYNDLSPLENFHASYSFEILRRPQNNFLQSVSLEDYNEIRKDIVSNILYTDIKEHFPLIKKFKAIEYKPQQKPLSPQDLRTLTGMIIHTSDFGGSAKEFQICKEWSRRVNLQFIAQYKQQEELGIAQTPFFKDLQVESIMAKNEMGFLKVIVFPLYEALDDFYKDTGVLKRLRVYAENNIKEWQKVHISTSTIKNEEKNDLKEGEKKEN